VEHGLNAMRDALVYATHADAVAGAAAGAERDCVMADWIVQFGDDVEWVDEDSGHTFAYNMGTPASVAELQVRLRDGGLSTRVICMIRHGNVYYTPADGEAFDALESQALADYHMNV
jgi:plastocyanin